MLTMFLSRWSCGIAAGTSISSGTDGSGDEAPSVGSIPGRAGGEGKEISVAVAGSLVSVGGAGVSGGAVGVPGAGVVLAMGVTVEKGSVQVGTGVLARVGIIGGVAV